MSLTQLWNKALLKYENLVDLCSRPRLEKDNKTERVLPISGTMWNAVGRVTSWNSHSRILKAKDKMNSPTQCFAYHRGRDSPGAP